MSLTVTKRPNNPTTSLALVNGSFTGSIDYWSNVGSGTSWVYNSNKARITVTDPAESKGLLQAFTIGEKVVYAYSFDIAVSSIGADDYYLNMIQCDSNGGFIGYIRQVDLSDGSQTISGTFSDSTDGSSYICFNVTLGGGA